MLNMVDLNRLSSEDIFELLRLKYREMILEKRKLIAYATFDTRSILMNRTLMCSNLEIF